MMPAASPAVSVVIATYNRADLLGDAIDSVLQQNFTDYEIIVVDDGSTDETPQVLQSYRGRIRAFRQDNRGPSAARNLGVGQARGRWIAFQDSDDQSAPDHLKILYGFVENQPSCGLVFGNGSYLDGPEHQRSTLIPQRKAHRLASQGVTLRDLFEKSIVRLQATMIAKAVFDAVGGFDETIRIGEDLDLVLRIWRNYSVAFVDQVVFAYRRHAGNMTANPELRLTENIRVIEKLLREYPEAERMLGKRRVHARLAYRYYRLSKARLKQGKADQSRHALKQAVRLAPFNPKYLFYQLLRAGS